MKTLLVFLSFVMVAWATYSVHVVEFRCRQGNESIIYDLNSVDSSSIILRAAKTTPYKPNKNCTIILKPPANYGVVLAVRKIDFIRDTLLDSKWDYLKVYHSAASSPTLLKRFKFDVYEKMSYSSNGPMTLLYHTGPRGYGIYLEIGFEVIATAFATDKIECNGKFHCDNGRCVEHALACDGHNNCGDSSDESMLTCDRYPILPDLPESYIVIISICVLLCLFVLSCTVFCCVKSKPHSYRSDSLSEPATNQPCATPYEAVHPSGYSISQNPAGPSNLYAAQHSSVIQHDGGFANPCYPSGIPQHPPPPYKP